MPKLPIPIALLLLVSPAQAQQATRQPSTDPWEVTEQTNQPTLTLELVALNMVSGSVFEVRPVLLVRCREHELDVFVSAGSALDSGDNGMTPVGIQLGARAPEETRWNRSTDSTSAFAPDPRAFLRQLLSSPDLRLEIHPSHRSPQVIRFNARGLERHMPQVDAACGSGGSREGQEAIAGQIYAPEDVDERPELVSAPPLAYPPLLRQAGLQGRVTVQAVIDTLGHAEPGSVKIMERTSTGFEESARDYVLHAVFRPGQVKGRAVRALVRVPLDYRIR
ncbi:MAG TPA: energy transducer TonB [Gemmatimonadales bacterium]|nr:energy transducer TonB [Gemmatimonadales bacterium]